MTAMGRTWMKAGGRMTAAAALVLTPAAMAANKIELSNDIFVERIERTSAGATRVHLDEPEQVVSGDRLVFVLRYRNTGQNRAGDLSITNPLPAAVAFAGDPGPSAWVSVDNGKSWGRLDALRVPLAGGGSRPALPEDITHIRWTVDHPVEAGAEGKFVFRARVR